MPPTTSTKQEPQQLSEDELIQLANEEYKTWKKNTPALYDAVITRSLEWPTLTLEWFPDVETSPDKPYTVHRLLLGTNTSGQEPNYLQIWNVALPRADGGGDWGEGTEKGGVGMKNWDNDKGEFSTYHPPSSLPSEKIRLVHSIPHPTEVNRARYMPQNPDLIATRTGMVSTGSRSSSTSSHSPILIFDRTRHPADPSATAPNTSSSIHQGGGGIGGGDDGDDGLHPEGVEMGTIGPQIRLRGHKREGYALCWNGTTEGRGKLVSGGEDAVVGYWDVEKNYTKDGGPKGIDPITMYKGHESTVNDVDWQRSEPSIFGSAGEDGRFFIWDTRVNPKDKALTASPRYSLPHNPTQPYTALSFATHLPNHFLLSTSDEIHLFDIRMLASSSSLSSTTSSSLTTTTTSPFNPLHTFVPPPSPFAHPTTSGSPNIMSLSWSPTEPTVFVSSGMDRRVRIWDVSKIGEEQEPEDEEDGPPELVFVHAGHTESVEALGWCPGWDAPKKKKKNDNNKNNNGKEKKKGAGGARWKNGGTQGRWTMASTSSDNILQIWSVGRVIWGTGEDEMEVDLKELE